MPINPVSIKNRKATNGLWVSDIKDEEEKKKYLGSPYSVADYKTVNPDYGTPQDFKDLINQIHESDMKVIIDWVPNHTGWDNQWIFDHPEWYTQDSLGNIIDPIDYNTGKSWGWTDVADLNYDNEEMREAMIESMQFWLSDFDIDGFRVDVAHGIPQDFWDQVTPALLSTKKDIFMFAASEVISHRNNNTYNATYGWSFHHLMNHIAKGEIGADSIIGWYKQDKQKFNKGFHVHFTSNHDENTWAGTVFDRMGDAHKALSVLAATLEGMFLIYNGQEEPLRKRLPFFIKEEIGFSDYAYEDFYKALFNLKHQNQALWVGENSAKPEFIHADENTIVYSRTSGDNEVVIILNLSDRNNDVSLDWDESSYTELFEAQLNRNEDQSIMLNPWDYYVFSK